MSAGGPAPARFADLTCLAVGHVTHDRYGDELELGGSAFYGASTCTALGARTMLATAGGDGIGLHVALPEVRVHRRAGDRPTCFTNRYDGDGRLSQWVEGIAPPVTPSVLPSTGVAVDALWLAPVIGELDPAVWLDAVEARLVGVGVQGFVRRPGALVGSRRLVEGGPLLLDDAAASRVGAAFLSEEDLELVGGPGLLDWLRSRVEIVALTRGAAGCTIYDRDGAHGIGIFETTAVDPTGAGDTFGAATMVALAAGWSSVEAARLGAAAASVVVEQRGGRGLAGVGGAFERRAAVAVG